MSNTASSSRPVPRPLHLSCSSSTSSSPRSSPVIAKSPLAAGSTNARVWNIEGRGPSSSSSSPVESPRLGAGQRRQSSLSYHTTRSSVTAASGASAASGQDELQQHVRRNTVGGGVLDTVQLKDGAAVRSRSVLQPVKEAEPVTLAEKHADLLRFIAQKESKCLELRTQLAQHESELLVLKQKWERIVSKGSPALSGSTTAAASASGSGSASTTRSSHATTGSDVLLGIREGVQNGFEKVMAVLEPAIAGAGSSSSSSSASESSSSESSSAASASASASSSSASGSPVSTTTSMPLPSKQQQQQRPSPSVAVWKHNKNAESRSSTQGRSSVSSSVSSLFDEDAHSNGTRRTLDSPVLEDGGFGYGFGYSKPSPSSPPTSSSSNGKHLVSPKDRPTSLSSTFSQLSTSLSSPDSIGKHVATWVSPSLNKKWEELRNNETISKQSKRASLLFNDVLSALSASTSSSSPNSALDSSQADKLPHPHPITDYLSTPISPLVLDPVVGAFIGSGTFSSSSSASLLVEDNDNDGPNNELGVVLRPDDHDRGLSVAAVSTKANTVPGNATAIKRGTPVRAAEGTGKGKGKGRAGAKDASVAVNDDSNDSDGDDDTQETWNW